MLYSSAHEKMRVTIGSRRASVSDTRWCMNMVVLLITPNYL